MPSRIILAAVLLHIAIAPGITAVETGSTSPSFLYTAAKIYEPLAWLHGAERFPSGAEVFISNESARHPLLPDFAASADPTVSFDGHRVLFSAKSRTTDPWQIWEVDLDGTAPRQITSFLEDCITPFYLPDDRVVYARKIGGRFVIESKELGSNKTLVLTYLPSSSVPTDILRDGRILFESAYPTGGGDAPEIYTVYSDGSGVESYRCDHGDARHSARQLASGDTVFASSRRLARFTSARAQELTIATPAGEFAGDVAETATGDWFLAWRPDTKVLYRLVRWTSPFCRTRQKIVRENGEARGVPW